MDLATSRIQTAARLSDPLWYRNDDVLPVEESAMAENAKVLPEQFQIVEAALRHNNLTRTDVTPQAFACLLEQARRYALEIIADSQDYAFVANRSEIKKEDLELAQNMRPDHPISASTQLPKLNLLAQQINRVPLPPIPTQCYSGVLLPPKHHQLTARTFDVVSGAQVAQKMVQRPLAVPLKKNSSKSKPSYGAARGRQIAVNLKEKEQPKPTEKEQPEPTEKTETDKKEEDKKDEDKTETDKKGEDKKEDDKKEDDKTETDKMDEDKKEDDKKEDDKMEDDKMDEGKKEDDKREDDKKEDDKKEDDKREDDKREDDKREDDKKEDDKREDDKKDTDGPTPMDTTGNSPTKTSSAPTSPAPTVSATPPTATTPSAEAPKP